MTTVDEVNSDKTKVPKEFIFHSVLLDCFAWLFYCRTRWVNWSTIDVSLYGSFLLRLYRCIRVCKRTIGSLFLCFCPFFSFVQLWNYTKTVIRLRLGEYCRIIVNYRIYSNERRSAYLIFRPTRAALIRGRRLLKNCTRRIYFFYIFIQRYTFYLLIFLWTDTKLMVNLELREKFTRWKTTRVSWEREGKYQRWERTPLSLWNN